MMQSASPEKRERSSKPSDKLTDGNTHVAQKLSESDESSKSKTRSVVLDANASQAIDDFCMKKYGTHYRVLGKEISNAIIFYLGAVDRQQSFTILSTPIKLSRETRRMLNAVIDAILKVAIGHRSNLIAHDIIVEVIKNTAKVKHISTVKHYITLLLQCGMERRIERSSNTSSIEVLYNVAAFVRAPSDNSHFKDINRTEANYRVEDAGQHPQCEDRPKPEKKGIGLRKGVK